MNTILVAVDGSEGARRAARFAAGLARETGAALELMHVYDMPTAVHLGIAEHHDGAPSALAESIAHGSFASVQKEIEGLEDSGHYIALGDPGEEIAKRARHTNAAIIVLGACGVRHPDGALLGSVGQRVVQLADRPVTIVP